MGKANWIDNAQKILAKLISRKDSEFFREPVLWEEMGLTDYLTVVKCPMDLSTVRSKLNEAVYDRSEEFSKDVRLIFINAMTYNVPGSRVYVNAKSLSEFFEVQWSTVRPASSDLDKPPSSDEISSWVEQSRRCFCRIELLRMLTHHAKKSQLRPR